MNSNAHYWTNRASRSEQAKSHTKEMAEKYAGEIRDCVDRTVTYSPGSVSSSEQGPYIAPSAWQSTTDGTLFEFPEETLGMKTAVLNFASYKNPGGMFLAGSMAQEEAVCHGSFLYNVLSADKLAQYYEWNRKNLNKGLYFDRALYTPDVVFISGTGEIRKADVLTCAAPNNSMPSNVPGIFSEDQNRDALHRRVLFVRDILMNQGVDRAVLGAWGCGVFRQDPENVAREFLDAFRHSGIECVYAVPDQKTYGVFRRAVDRELEIAAINISGEDER